MSDNSKNTVDNVINKVLNASFGEASNKLTVSFKKTVLIRNYETEVIESSATIDIDEAISGAERAFITAVMRVQMEYEAYCNLLMKGMVTQMEYNQRKEALANDVMALKEKAEAISGKSMDKYLEQLNG